MVRAHHAHGDHESGAAVRFHFSHDFDLPIDVLERALVSPALRVELAARLTKLRGIESVRHELAAGELHRVWRYRAAGAPPWLARAASTVELMVWDEHTSYRLSEHAGEWHVVALPDAPADAPWRKRFASAGRYALAALGDRRTRRTVEGTIDIKLPLVDHAVERWASAEIAKVYGAEAAALRTLGAPS